MFTLILQPSILILPASLQIPLYIRRCGPGEVTIGGTRDSSVVCNYCGLNVDGGFRAQVSFNPGNSSCDGCPVGAELCDGVLLTPQDNIWHSSPFSLQVRATDLALQAKKSLKLLYCKVQSCRRRKSV
jgi:hypothetical protein